MPKHDLFHLSSLVSGTHPSCPLSNIDVNCSTTRRSVGALYLYSADSIRKQTDNGLEMAVGEYIPLINVGFEFLTFCHDIPSILGTSALLLAASAPRLRRGPMPLMLTAASLGAGSYYARTTYRVRQHRMSDKTFWMTPSHTSKH